MKHISTRAQFLLESERTVTKRTDGSIELEEWLENGNPHRLGGPAWIWYYPNGSIKWEIWYQNGQRHRLDGPAWIEYRPDGSIEWEAWYENDKVHRLGGPAYIEYNRDGSIQQEEWYLKDSKLGEEKILELKLAAARKELKELGFSDEDADLIAPFF